MKITKDYWVCNKQAKTNTLGTSHEILRTLTNDYCFYHKFGLDLYSPNLYYEFK